MRYHRIPTRYKPLPPVTRHLKLMQLGQHAVLPLPQDSATMGSDMCERYQRLAVSGWEHNRGRSKLREMKSDPWSLNLPLTSGLI
jgi:hypothetical protein